MHLYDCRVGEFIPNATAGQIADILRQRFVDRLDSNPSKSEVLSWKMSLEAFAESIADAMMDNAWIVLEYQLPLSSSRLDAMLIGSDEEGQQNAALLEFKQWDRCISSIVPELVGIRGAHHLHPCAQVRSYREYLRDAHSAFIEDQIRLSSCAYLHNVKSLANSGFYGPVYEDLLADSPAFCMESVGALTHFLKLRVGQGADQPVVESILRGGYRPSKKLLEQVAASIAGYEPWHLLDDQLAVYGEIFASVESARAAGEKRVIVATGGPGTGKSVIALQVVGAAACRGYQVAHVTASKAFTTNVRGIVGRSELFRYSSSFHHLPESSIELVVCDEAHRFREKSTQGRFRVLSDRPQVHDIIDAARVAVFLLDERQSIRADEIGSVAGIQEYAQSRGIPVTLHDLRTQFRCAGSNSYTQWVDYVLGLGHQNSLAWQRNGDYEVKVFGQVDQMETALREKMELGYSSRLVAGYCWEWTDPLPDGSLVADVVIGNWARPWNRRPADMCKSKGSPEPPSRHPYTIWATRPEAFAQVGCIYSAQGFEFDYVGVIFGQDLRWNPQHGSWEVALQNNKDRTFKKGQSDFKVALEKLKNIYRVLSTRGMKGTYFYFLDDATRRYFEALLAGGEYPPF